MDRANTTLIYQHQTHTAHRLQNHKGKCRNLHGHTYTFTLEFISLSGNGEPFAGMIMDFGDVKELAGGWLDNAYDHALVLEKTDPLVNILGEYYLNLKLRVCEDAPTAENMAKEVLDAINGLLYSQSSNVRCVAVSVEESPGKAARCVKGN